MQKQIDAFVRFAAVAGLVAGVGDFLVTLILGFFYPNYSHLRFVMSELGTAKSPVALWVNAWWMIFGILFILFAIGFWRHFKAHQLAAAIIALLIVLFGLGAGIGGGVFPMASGGLETTLAGKLHGIFAGIGFMALAFVPLAALGIFSRPRAPRLYWISMGVFISGLVFLGWFIAAEDAVGSNGPLAYTGFWQRLFLLNHYGYLSLFAAKMLDH
ncbi:MAG: DUF998 domain-containing protein [Chloroflexi bacterium]|nr:DUF998 domain-containing protein [Chloroflexota bacterium]